MAEKRVMVAVSNDLYSVKAALEEAGFQTVGIADNLAGVHAVVTSGIDQAFLGESLRATRAPVIDAAGLSPDQVVESVRRAVEVRGQL